MAVVNNGFEFDRELFRGYISRDGNKNYDLKLYKKYLFYKKIFKTPEDMQKAEEKIYTVNGVVLSDSKRIRYELKRILDFLDKPDITTKISVSELSKIRSLINSLNASYDELENNVISSSSIIKKMKKDISYIQLKLGLCNNFFEATKELFEDTYNNMMIADMENKKVL